MDRLSKKLITNGKLLADERSGLSRRRFIKHFAVGTALSTVFGRGWVGMLVADCQPTLAGAGILRVKVADFPALQNENGSVRLALNPFTSSGPSGTFYPVLVNRGTGDEFFTLRSRCSHQGCVVPAFNAGIGVSVCPCHGSRYAIDGTVVAGPALQSLTTYTNNFDGTVLCIEIPGLGYSVTGTLVESGVGPRVQLKFPTKSGVKYQVLSRQSAMDAGTVIQFTTTIGGAATSSVLTGNNATATMFVDRTFDTGFYSVAVLVSQG